MWTDAIPTQSGFYWTKRVKNNGLKQAGDVEVAYFATKEADMPAVVLEVDTTTYYEPSDYLFYSEPLLPPSD